MKSKEELRGEENKGPGPSFSLEHLLLAEANKFKKFREEEREAVYKQPVPIAKLGQRTFN